MKHSWNRKISGLLAAVMLFTMLPMTAMAEESAPNADPAAATVPAEKYTVALTATDGGRVSGGGAYAEGEEVTAAAHPADGYQFDGWYDGANLVSLTPVYTFAAAETVSYQAAFTAAAGEKRRLTVTCDADYTSSVTLTDGKADLDLGTSVTLTFTDTTKEFLYWVNESNNILSTSAEYSFTLAGNTTITAKYVEKDNTKTRVIFRNAFSKIIFDKSVDKNAVDLSAALDAGLSATPSKMGHTFLGWYLADENGELPEINPTPADGESIATAVSSSSRVVVLPRYEAIDSTFSITVTCVNDDGTEITGASVTPIAGVKVGQKQNVSAPKIENKIFQCWKIGGKIVGYDSVYTVLRAEAKDVALTAVYGDAVTLKPIVNITQTYATREGGKYVISNTMQYYLPEGYQLLEAGFVYGTSYAKFGTGNGESNLYIGANSTKRSVDSNTANRGLYTFNGKTANPATTLYIKAYIIYKNTDTGEVPEPVYSAMGADSYYSLTATEIEQSESSTPAVSVNEKNKIKETAQTVIVTQKENDTVAATATVPQGVKLVNNVAVSNGIVTLTVATKETTLTNPHNISLTSQESINYSVSITGVDGNSNAISAAISEDNTTPILVCLKSALAPGLTGVTAYHNGDPMGSGASPALKDANTFYYDPTTGDVYICVTHFSNFTFGYKRPATVSVAFPNTDKYLYRVGNQNAVPINKLFTVNDPHETGATLSVSVDTTDAVNSISADNITFKNTFTGVVNVTATLTANDVITATKTLPLEVVAAKNVTQYSELTNANCVLLNNITMSSGGQCSFTNATLYGNGFTFDITEGRRDNTTSGNDSNSYVIYLNSSKLNNIAIVGAVYENTSVAQVKDRESFPAVKTVGNCEILNSYISNTSSPVRASGGNLRLVNSTLAGGGYCNLDIREGSVELTDITTINQANSNDDPSVVGAGIVIWHENADSASITINGTLNQYNVLSKSDVDNIKNVTAKTMLSGLFTNANTAPFRVGTGDDAVLNTGIVILDESLDGSAIKDNRSSHSYDGANYGSRYFYTTTAPTMLTYTDGVKTGGQAPISPVFSFDHTVNYQAAEGATYCTGSGKTVQISFEMGSSKDYNPFIASFNKPNCVLESVSMGNTVFHEGDKIHFDDSGNYSIEYSVSDPNNYRINEDGNIERYTVTYTDSLTIEVHTVESSWEVEFTFLSGGKEVTGITKTVGDKVYIVPDTNDSDYNAANYSTKDEISGPNVYLYFSDGTGPSNEKITHTSKYAAYYPLFRDALKIKEKKGSTVVTTDDSTGVNAVEERIGVALEGINRNNTSGKYAAFNYQASAVGTKTISRGKIKNAETVYISSPGGIEALREATSNDWAEFTFTSQSGAKYYYRFCYQYAEQPYDGGCLAAGTLINLADGTQKPIEELTGYETIMTWDFETGSYVGTPIGSLIYHGEGRYQVVRLMFDEATTLDIIGAHYLFCQDTNRWESISAQSAEYFIGKNFVTVDGAGNTSVKTLHSVDVMTEETGSYSILSAGRINTMANGLLSSTPFAEYLDPFTVGDGLKYDEALMQHDIDTYGWMTYQEFMETFDAEGITEDVFNALNGKVIKIAIGKGISTVDYINDCIAILLKDGLYSR